MAKPAAARNLTQQSNRHALISVFLFAILIGTISFNYYSARTDMHALQALQQDRVQLDRFAATLPRMLAPVADFMVSGDQNDGARQATAFIAFQHAYNGVSSQPGFSPDQHTQLKQVFDLIQRAQAIATGLFGGQTAHAKDLLLVAHALVATAQTKTSRVAQALGQAQRRQVRKIQTRMTMLTAADLAVIVVLLLAMVLLTRGLSKGLVRSLADIASGVGRASGKMIDAAEQQVEAAETQAVSLEEAMQALEQMSGASGKIAATASSMERIVEATARAVAQAGGDVTQAAGLMQGIRDATHAISERGQASRQQTEHIMASLTTVQEIADETHLLALNASIESAASGEHGKRFAVVAAEVRRLAERVREFTEEIEGVVGEVNAAASASIEVTEGSLAEVDKGMAMVQRAGKNLAQIQGMSGKSVQAAHAIAQVMARQDKSSQAFLEDMRQMAKALRDSAQQLQDSRDISQRLMGMAGELQRLL